MIQQTVVPLVDLRAQHQSIRGDILAAIDHSLERMQLFLGENVVQFEREFADYCGVPHCIGVGSGTDALYLALRACDVGSGDEVITVANTFIATVEAIEMVGARPVFVDVDPRTHTIDVRQIAAHLTARSRAIVPVHLYGQMADMRPILGVARAHGLRVIEDACQAHGARYEDCPPGSFGDAACFSFYFSKNLGAYGEAGAVVTRDSEVAHTVAMLRDHGSDVKYHHPLFGMNSRLDELQAAVLRVKLRHLDRWNELRRSHAARYDGLLSDSGLTLPAVAGARQHVFHLYVVQSAERDRLRSALERDGIATGIHYPTPVHLQPAAEAYGYHPGSLPVTEMLAGRILSLPLYPELATEQIEYVCDCIRRHLNGHRGRSL